MKISPSMEKNLEEVDKFCYLGSNLTRDVKRTSESD